MDVSQSLQQVVDVEPDFFKAHWANGVLTIRFWIKRFSVFTSTSCEHRNGYWEQLPAGMWPEAYHNCLMLHVRHDNHRVILLPEAVRHPHHIFSSSAKTKREIAAKQILTQFFFLSREKKKKKYGRWCCTWRCEQTHPATVRHWSSAAIRVGWLVGMRCFRANISLLPSRSWASPRYTELNVPDSEIQKPGTHHPLHQTEFS